MNAVHTAAVPLTPVDRVSRVPMIGVLRALLLSEAVAGLGLAIFFSLLAAAERDFLGGDAGRAAEETLRFAAGGAFLFAVFAAVASRGARRRRRWSWTLSAMLQVVVAIGTGVAVIAVEWQAFFLAGFAAAAIVMLVLSTTSVRRALDQE
jgi:hypothetical protein